MRSPCFRMGSEESGNCKDNFTKIDNSLLRSLCLLKPNQAKVMLYFLRYTLGYHRAGCSTSCKTIGRWCRISRPNVQKAVQELEKLSLLRVVSNRPNLSVIVDPQSLTAAIIRLRGAYLAKHLSEDNSCE